MKAVFHDGWRYVPGALVVALAGLVFIVAMTWVGYAWFQARSLGMEAPHEQRRHVLAVYAEEFARSPQLRGQYIAAQADGLVTRGEIQEIKASAQWLRTRHEKQGVTIDE